MKIIKEKGKYYVNDLDLEEILANRKHVISYINKEIALVSNLLSDTCNYSDFTINTFKTRLKVLEDVKKELKLRK